MTRIPQEIIDKWDQENDSRDSGYMKADHEDYLEICEEYELDSLRD